MHQVLGGLREIPLDVAAESRVVVEDAQRDRAQPLAVGSEHLERSVVEIEMPQRPDVRRLRSCGPRGSGVSVSARASPGRCCGRSLGLRTRP